MEEIKLNLGTTIADTFNDFIIARKAKGLADKIEGWPGEPEWRRKSICDMFKFIERETGKDLGSRFMEDSPRPATFVE